MTTTEIRQVDMRVYGIPAPQGSKTAFVRNGRAVVVEGSSTAGRQKVSSWRAEVAREGEGLGLETLLEGPLDVAVEFYMPKPKSAPKGKRWCDKKPDIDKLVRSTLDALTNVVFRDDGQIVKMSVMKRYVHDGEPSGASISVRTLLV